MFRHQRWTQKPQLGVRINPAHSLAKGLVGCWLFNEGSGNKVYDLSGNGNHGTLVGMAFPPTIPSGWHPGRDGTALALDGTNDYVNAGNSSSLDIAGDLTISFWAKPDSLGTAGNSALSVFFYKGSWRAGGYYIQRNLQNLGRQGSLGLTTNQVGAHQFTESANGVLVVGEWHHYIVIKRETTCRIYKDGIEVAYTAQAAHLDSAPSSSNFQISRYADEAGDYFFDGHIDHASVYNRALTPQEILELYENPYGMFSWPSMWPVEAPPPPTHRPRSPAVSGVPSAHF